MKSALGLLPIVYLLAIGCSKEPPKQEPPGEMEFHLEHTAGEDSLEFSKMIYTNAAGNQYSVLRLKYFISGLKLYRGGQLIYEQKSEPAPINALYVEDRSFSLADVPPGSYDSLAFSLGAVPAFNYDNAFPLGHDNWDMYWPTSMGGGYHFMKFEGHWQHGSDFGGYAFHIGQNENLVSVGFPVHLEFASGKKTKLTAIMDVSQWFENPHLYDLRLEGGYTMGDSKQMEMLVGNGHNVFTLKQE